MRKVKIIRQRIEEDYIEIPDRAEILSVEHIPGGGFYVTWKLEP
jgi:hypothetical protein